MKLGVFDPLFRSLELTSMLDTISDLGLDAVEVSTGGYVGNSHCDTVALLADTAARDAFAAAFAERGLMISALSCHGNPLHPGEEQARRFHEAWRNSVLLAEQLGVSTVVTFSGCPGGGPDDRVPNWVTCAWPTDHAQALEWQWQERVIPYWQEEAAFAEAHGVQVAIEMHPGFVVYHPENMLRLRDAVGTRNLGTNFDPSHLFWQGVDVVAAIRHLGDAIVHVHAKDTHIDPVNAPLKGVLDTTPYGNVAQRSWVFRTVGYGHGELTWRQIISALRTVGYDGVVSIEHEDALASRDEGLAKAVDVLRTVILSEPVGTSWWTG
jgi:sugar phosphate isomerase/epimerase